MSEINQALEAFRSLPEAPEVLALLRERLGLPTNYAELEQSGKLPAKHKEALIVYRALAQESL